jgi:NAD+ dependent glucose-6-phosphate dehydrogenase
MAGRPREPTVLLTGASGRVGRAIIGRLGDAYDWRLVDREPPTGDTEFIYLVADITDEGVMADAMADVDVVVHLAGDPRPEAPWDSVLENNIDGTYTVLEAAANAGVEKFVFASSNHVVGGYETDERTPGMYRSNGEFRLDDNELPRPSNLYGVSKAAGETLCRYYHDAHGISVVCLRIGNLTKNHPPEGYERGQAMWLSYRDCAHLFERAIEADYGYEIVYGISDNDRKYYSLERAREVLGYEPQDDSAEY